MDDFHFDGFDDLLMDDSNVLHLGKTIVPHAHPPTAPVNNHFISTSTPSPYTHTPKPAAAASVNIPGPAGRIAAHPALSGTDDMFAQACNAMLDDPQEDVNECDAWRAALDALDIPCADVQSMVGGSVQTVLDKGKSTRVRQMLVLVASISQPLADGDAFVIVKDHTASMGACFHSTTLSHSLGISPGAALLLHDVPVLKVGHDAHYLCVQPSSIGQVFPASSSRNNQPRAAVQQPTNLLLECPTNMMAHGASNLVPSNTAPSQHGVPLHWQVVPQTQHEGVQVVAATPSTLHPAATPAPSLFGTQSVSGTAAEDADPLALRRMTRTKRGGRSAHVEVSCTDGGGASVRVPCTDVTNTSGPVGGGEAGGDVAEETAVAAPSLTPSTHHDNMEQPPAKRRSVQPTAEADILVLMDGLDEALFG